MLRPAQARLARAPKRPAGARRGGRGVRVVSGPRGLELRVDGTHASHRRVGQLSAGPVWDALALPSLVLRGRRRPKVAILGLGGGSVAHLVRAVLPDAAIVGIERNAEVVEAARRHFDLDALGLEIALANALAWLLRQRRRFDLIVEDCFVGPSRAVRKPAGFPEPGLSLAARRLTAGGILICNTIHEGSAYRDVLRRLLPHRLDVAVAGHWNHILGGARRPLLDARGLRRAARTSPLAPSLRQLTLRRF